MKKNTSSDKPLFIFFALSFLLAWSLMSLFIAQFRGWISLDIPFEPFLIIGSWVPNIAAFIVIAFVLKRKGGISRLLKGWLKFKVPLFWYLVTLTPVIFALLSMGIYRLIFGDTPVNDIVFDPISILALLVISTITGATGEELGWRGFALPRLQMKMSALNASLILGVIWAIWHLPLWFAGLGYEKIPFTIYAFLIMSETILITWACNNSRGSMVIATFYHLTMNIAMNIIEIEALFLYSILIFIFTVIVVLLYGPTKLSKATEIPIDKDSGDWLP